MAWSIFKDGGGDPVAVGWAHQFLKLLGAPDTPSNVEFIYQWEKSEGGGGKYNPLNTGPVTQHPEWTTTGEQYGGGAADYASWEAGQLGSAYFLEHYQQDTYSKILSALRANDPVSARQALWASPWAAGHYGYGSNWSNATVPGSGFILPQAGSDSTSGDILTKLVTDKTTANTDETCAWKINFPVAGSTCVASKVATRHLVGVGLMVAALGVGLVGAVILVVYASQKTGAGRAVTAAAGAIPGEGLIVRRAAGAAGASNAKTGRTKNSGKQPSGTGTSEGNRD